MLYQLYARRFPYWSTYEQCRSARLEEVAALAQDAPLPLDYGPWLEMSREGLAFLRGCLTRDYAQRMTVEEALDHPWCAGGGGGRGLEEGGGLRGGRLLGAGWVVRSGWSGWVGQAGSCGSITLARPSRA